MNRSTSLLIAFGVLVAHALVLFQDALGSIAHPFDEVHVAFHMARNLVRTGSVAFNAGGPVLESYPSLAWVALAAVAERFYQGPNFLAQLTALLSALSLVWIVSRFSPNRLAGVMAPLFVVVSGSVAASIGSGTEWATFALLCTAGLLFLEEARPRLVAATCSAALLVRPEGVLLVLGLTALAVASRARRRGEDEPRPGQARVRLSAFMVPVLLWLLIGGLRLAVTGYFLPPVLLDALAPTPERFSAGARFVLDFGLRSGAMTLAVVPVAFLVVGRLSPRGRRALTMGLAWCLFVIWQGGHRAPMWLVMVPAIPFLAVAIQEALTDLVDRQSVWVQRAAWATFLIGLAGSTIVSRRSTNLGPLPLESVQREWLANPKVERLFGSFAGRRGLVDRIQSDERRRCAAIFLRENLEPGALIATFWPGATAYIARKPVMDLTGRATIGPAGRLLSGYGPLRVDVVGELESQPDFILPPTEIAESETSPERLARSWLHHLDVLPNDPDRVTQLAQILGHYELVSVPIPWHSSQPHSSSAQPYEILRHERLGTPTQLRIEVSSGRLVVEAQHVGHQQVVDLVVTSTDGAGAERYMRPAGTFVADDHVHARSHLLLHASGRRWIRMLDVPFSNTNGDLSLRATLAPPALFESAGGRVARVEANWP